MKGSKRRFLSAITAALLIAAMLPVQPAAAGSATPMVAAGNTHTVGLKADGTVFAVGSNTYGQSDVSSWTDINTVAAGGVHTVGNKADGTVVAVGYNGQGQCDVSGWAHIIAVAAGEQHTVGIFTSESVVAVGHNDYGQCNVSGWTDITAVAAGSWHTIGLKADGTVVAVGHNDYGQCDVSGWTDITAVAAGGRYTVGLKADGTVVAVGDNNDGQCDVSGWAGITAVATGGYHTVGLKADGTVVAAGNDQYGQLDVSGWTGISAIAAGVFHTVGLKADGVVVAVGWNEFGQLNVSGWNLSSAATTGGDIHITADVAPPPPSLTFTVSPGAAPAGGGVTASALAFGTLSPATPKTGSHYLGVSTNAVGGYLVTAAESSPLRSEYPTATVSFIPDVSGDEGTITHFDSGPWSQSSTYGFGYTLANRAGSDAVFTAGYKRFADLSSGQSAQAVMASSAPVASSETELTYKVNISATQPQGSYATTVTYVATGNF